MTDQPATASYVNDYVPPIKSGDSWTPSAPVPLTSAPVSAPTPSTSAQTSPTTESSLSQALEDQNIFHLLGVTSATDAEKESFLDELQQIIWEDFLANDVDLLVTENEKIELKKIMDGKDHNDLETQEAIVVYLEKLIPDLEEIMLEKALELKGDMVKERLSGMREHYATQPEKIESLNKAEVLMVDDRWHDLAEALNKLSP